MFVITLSVMIVEVAVSTVNPVVIVFNTAALALPVPHDLRSAVNVITIRWSGHRLNPILPPKERASWTQAWTHRQPVRKICTTGNSALSLHDALPILERMRWQESDQIESRFGQIVVLP